MADRPRRRRRVRLGSSYIEARIRYFKRFFPDDIAEIMAYRFSIRGRVGRRAVTLMRRRLRAFRRANPEIPLDDARDIVFNQIELEVEEGTETDYAFLAIMSP